MSVNGIRIPGATPASVPNGRFPLSQISTNLDFLSRARRANSALNSAETPVDSGASMSRLQPVTSNDMVS